MANYSSLIKAQAYFNTRLNADAWDCASEVNKTKALNMATRIIDSLNFEGSKTDSAQELQFPRFNDVAVPVDIEIAEAEIALALLDDVDPDFEFENLRMSSQVYGSIKSTYDASTELLYKAAGVPSVVAWRLLRPYMRDFQSVDVNRVS